MPLLSEIALILMLIVAGGVFAMAEMAVVSVRKPRLLDQSEREPKGARNLLRLTESPQRFLAVLQFGITLIAIFIGAMAAVTVAKDVAVYVGRVPLLAPHANEVALGLVVLVVACLSLVIGEWVPQRLASHNPERVALTIAGPLRVLALVATPFVRVLNALAELLLRAFHVLPQVERAVTEDDIKNLVEQSTEAGVLLESERSMVEQVLLLDGRRVNSLMTPRPEIVWLDMDDSPQEIQRKITECAYSRFPVAQGDLDNLLGELHIKDLLTQDWYQEGFDLPSLLREPLFVPEFAPVLLVLEEFKRSGTAIALVTDEYGSVQGLISQTDILEAIVGDIADPHQPPDPQAIQREDGSWLVDGLLPIDEFKEAFGLTELPDEESRAFQTVAGFAVMQLKHIPSVADCFEWGHLRLEIADMDGPRVDKLIVTVLQDAGLVPGED
jgi:putative hemolysin